MLTEDDARKKWCPARMIAAAVAMGNRNVSDPDQAHSCIASDCMAWRKREPRDMDERRGPERGYCGLAGKP